MWLDLVTELVTGKNDAKNCTIKLASRQPSVVAVAVFGGECGGSQLSVVALKRVWWISTQCGGSQAGQLVVGTPSGCKSPRRHPEISLQLPPFIYSLIFLL